MARLLPSLVRIINYLYVRRKLCDCDWFAGANTGIGKETAIDLAKRGARVIILCRSMERAEAALKDIKSASGNNNVEVEQLDLSSFKSIRQCAAILQDKLDKIDILINNAGVMLCPKDWKTEDGFEMQFGTNHLGHFLLTELLLPLVKKSAASGFHPRIINVSSMGHAFAKDGINFDDLNFEVKRDDEWKVYGHSKLANILHAKELARRLENTGISVYSLHPGAIGTDLGRHMEEKSACIRCIKPCFYWMIKTPWHGAQTTLYCALEDKIEHESGLYYSDCDKKTPSAPAQDMDAAERLWEVSEKLVGLDADAEKV